MAEKKRVTAMAKTCKKHEIDLTDEAGEYCPSCLAAYEQEGEPDGCFFCAGPHPSTSCPEVD